MKLLTSAMILFLWPRLLPAPEKAPQWLTFASLLYDARNAPQMYLKLDVLTPSLCAITSNLVQYY